MARRGYPQQDFEFICAGLAGSVLFQNLVYYKLYLRYFRPDLIVLYCNINDNGDIRTGPYTYRELFTLNSGVDISRLWIDEFQFPKTASLIGRTQGLLQHLRTYNFLVTRVLKSREGTRLGGLYREVNPVSDYKRNLRDFIEIVHKDGGALILADAYGFVQKDCYDSVTPCRRLILSRIMERTAGEMNVPFVPVLRKLQEKFTPGELLQENDKGHINAKGHREAALLIFEKIVEMDLLTQR